MFLTRQEIRQKAGELVICGFDGTSLNAELKEIFREVQPLGLILFARNIESVEHVFEFNRELKSYRNDAPLLLSVDQEGGRVARVKAPATPWPPMRQLGKLKDADLVRAVGAALAREMRALNFDVDFAPVLDVDTNPDNPVIADRSFSDDPAEVSRLGVALLEGLQNAGVAACGKHFPGHGDTDKDSHHALPTVSHDLQRLQRVEWPPFEAAIRAGVSSIMTAHVVVEALDPHAPATLSTQVIGEHLRKGLGFDGVIVSDDIEMKAVAATYEPQAIARLGLLAGIDVFLACHRPAVTMELFRGIIQAVEQEHVSHQTLAVAAARATAWRQRYYQGPSSLKTMRSVFASGEHAQVLQTIHQRLAAADSAV